MIHPTPTMLYWQNLFFDPTLIITDNAIYRQSIIESHNWQKESRQWFHMLKAIVDNMGEFTPEQHHARWDVGGHTDEVDVVYFALYWYLYISGYEVFIIRYLLSIL